MEARDSFCFPKNTKNPNPSPVGKKFGFCCCGAPPGTRTLGPLIKRNQRATIVSFQNCVNLIFLSFCRKFAFCICCILCTCYSLLHPLSSRSGVQKVCKNVQSQNQPFKTGIGFLCNGVKTGLFHPAKATLYITNLYHTSNVHPQLRFMAGIWTTAISYKSKAALSMWTFLGGNTQRVHFFILSTAPPSGLYCCFDIYLAAKP